MVERRHVCGIIFFFSSRRRHTRLQGDWSSDVCSSDLIGWDGSSCPTYGPMEMLYDCENVRTHTFSTKLNTPPNAAFRAPGFVEGTFGLESLLDELAAKLDLDPLELRRRNYADHDLVEGRPFSSQNLLDCYRMAEPHWSRREAVGARPDAGWKPGVGAASQTRTGAG